MNIGNQPQQVHKLVAIGNFACGVAHDFNNILSSIIGLTELAVSNLDDKASVQNKLGKVLKAGYQAKDLINHILDFSRCVEQEKKPVQIKLIIKEDLKLLRASIPATIEIRQKIESDSMVLADPAKIHRILMNLGINAAHAMGKAGGVLEVSLTDVELDHDFASENPDITSGQYICLAVSDTAQGMSSELIKRIFDPFFTTKRCGKGTGLGLAISLNGAISVQSTPPKGSMFRVFLPIIVG